MVIMNLAAMQPICNEREPRSKAAIVRSKNIVRNTPMLLFEFCFQRNFRAWQINPLNKIQGEKQEHDAR